MFHYPASTYAKSSILYFILFYFNLFETDSYYVTHIGLEFMVSPPQAAECWNGRRVLPCLAMFVCFKQHCWCIINIQSSTYLIHVVWWLWTYLWHHHHNRGIPHYLQTCPYASLCCLKELLSWVFRVLTPNSVINCTHCGVQPFFRTSSSYMATSHPQQTSLLQRSSCGSLLF